MSFIFCGNKSLDNCLLAYTICWKAAGTVEEWRLTDSLVVSTPPTRTWKPTSRLSSCRWGGPSSIGFSATANWNAWSTLFLTFSCAEYESPGILGYLKKVNDVPNNYPSGRLYTEDPISVSRTFSQKFHSFFQTVIVKGQVLGKVTHYFWKKEYQARGAPHTTLFFGLMTLRS